MLAIHEHANLYPNSGSVVKALSAVQKRIAKKPPPLMHTQVLIAIVADITLHNPRCTAVCAAILSQLLQNVESQSSKLTMLGKILGKFDRVPNTGHMQIWLQRISQPIATDIPYREPLCQLVSGEPIALWENDWITNIQLAQACNPQEILDRESMKSLSMVIDASEFKIFGY
jgi:hypothetical protein